MSHQDIEHYRQQQHDTNDGLCCALSESADARRSSSADEVRRDELFKRAIVSFSMNIVEADDDGFISTQPLFLS
jgi:hypothetical protein